MNATQTNTEAATRPDPGRPIGELTPDFAAHVLKLVDGLLAILERRGAHAIPGPVIGG